jgi:DNA-binding IclR family transcriptional regulator
MMEGSSAQRNPSRPRPGTTALDRSLDVLESILANAPEVRLATVAAQTGFPKATVHRIIAVWARRGYVASTRRGSYGPGAQLFTAAGMAHAALDYSRVALPLLSRLRDYTDDTIHLGLRLGDEAVYVHKLEARRPYHMVSVVGMTLSLHCTAIGKAILAHATDREQVLRRLRLEERTSQTITDRGKLKADLNTARRRGFAIDDEENEEGVRCVGAPVFDYHGEVVGAISVSAPAVVFSLDQAIALGPHLIETSTAVSLALGFSAQASSGL